jgi:uncharacterized iron-regulated protein
MAGYLLARFIAKRPAKVAMIAGSLSYRAHGEREMGFLDILQELYPNIDVVGLREGHDDEALNYRQMRRFCLIILTWTGSTISAAAPPASAARSRTQGARRMWSSWATG